MRHFCETLDIPLTEVPDWYAEFRPKTTKSSQLNSEPMETQAVRYRRQPSPSETRPSQSVSITDRASSPMRAPQTRRTRRGR